jgi:hypothetical protein
MNAKNFACLMLLIIVAGCVNVPVIRPDGSVHRKTEWMWDKGGQEWWDFIDVPQARNPRMWEQTIRPLGK